MGKLVKENHVKGSSLEPHFNVSKVRAMSDIEAEKRAKSDPDAQPLTEDMLKSFKRVKK
jgi:hypothetical protein